MENLHVELPLIVLMGLIPLLLTNTHVRFQKRSAHKGGNNSYQPVEVFEKL